MKSDCAKALVSLFQLMEPMEDNNNNVDPNKIEAVAELAKLQGTVLSRLSVCTKTMHPEKGGPFSETMADTEEVLAEVVAMAYISSHLFMLLISFRKKIVSRKVFLPHAAFFHYSV